MHFRTPFVFIATTSVTAVLATYILHNHNRRDADQIASLIAEADTIVVSCTQNITSEQKSGGSFGSHNVPAALESYATSLGIVGQWVSATPPLDEDDSQTIINNIVLPYYQDILENANTVISIVQFVAKEGNVTVDATANMLKQINDNIKQFPAGMSLLFTANSLTKLDSINEQVQTAVTKAQNTYEGLSFLSGL